MKVGDLARDKRCGTLCIIKEVYERKPAVCPYAVVWPFSGNEEVEINAGPLEVVNESR